MPEFEETTTARVGQEAAGGGELEAAPATSNGLAAPPEQEALLDTQQEEQERRQATRDLWKAAAGAALVSAWSGGLEGEEEDREPAAHAAPPRKVTRRPEGDTSCGLGRWAPRWLQPFASKKTYVLLHGLIGMNTFALGSYFVATISTLEKRFKIPSRTSGLISSAWDIGSMVSLLALSYLGSRGHKPRWVAAGTLLVALSCLLRMLPHLLYGPGQDALRLTAEFGANDSLAHDSNYSSPAAMCGSAADYEDCSSAGGVSSSMPSIIFFVAHLVLGAGGSMYFTLGLAYMDDNTTKNKAPILLAVSQCLRMLGPTLGFMVASYALRLYVVPDLTPVIDSDDPRWIGAWWLAWLPFGCVAALLSTVLVLFPRRLPRAAQRRAEQNKPQDVKRSFKDFRSAFSRLAKNPVLLFNTFSGVCFMFGLIGYWTFMPKYMETQFRQSASTASLISGSVGLVFSALGVMTSALVISKFKPRARVLAAWNVAVELIDVVGHLSWAFISCPSDDLQGAWAPDSTWNMTSACNSGCSCGPHVKYAPVCAEGGGATFYSACHAGCSMASTINGTTLFSECSCVPGSGRAVEGTCPTDCFSNFALFIALQCVMRFMGSTGRAGNTIIQFRCVDEVDKPLAIAFTEVLLCGLAFIPGPIVYGLLLDYACMVWGESCGHSGNCWLYDGQTLRYLLNFTAAGCLTMGTLLDMGVWYHVKGLRIYDEDGSVQDETPGPRSRAMSFNQALAEENDIATAML